MERCRRALSGLEIEGEPGGIPELAQATGFSISTVCRALSSSLRSMPVVERIVREPRLTLDKVMTRDDDQDGAAGVETRRS